MTSSFVFEKWFLMAEHPLRAKNQNPGLLKKTTKYCYCWKKLSNAYISRHVINCYSLWNNSLSHQIARECIKEVKTKQTHYGQTLDFGIQI